MKCVDCRYSLPCFAGTLDKHTGRVTLCVQCGRLEVSVIRRNFKDQDDIVAHVFVCEQRVLTVFMRKHHDAARLVVEREHLENRFRSEYMGSVPHTVANTLIPDMGPGLESKLSLAECCACTGFYARMGLGYTDLDEEARPQKRIQPPRATIWMIPRRR